MRLGLNHRRSGTAKRFLYEALHGDGDLMSAGVDIGRRAARATSDALKSMGEGVRHSAQGAIKAGTRARRTLERGISRKPWSSVGIAFAAGAAISTLLLYGVTRGRGR